MFSSVALRKILFFRFWRWGGKETKLILTSRENEEKRHHCLQPERKRKKIGKRREEFGSKERTFSLLHWGEKKTFFPFPTRVKVISVPGTDQVHKKYVFGTLCVHSCLKTYGTCTEFFILLGLSPFLFPGFRETSN